MDFFSLSFSTLSWYQYSNSYSFSLHSKTLDYSDITIIGGVYAEKINSILLLTQEIITLIFII